MAHRIQVLMAIACDWESDMVGLLKTIGFNPIIVVLGLIELSLKCFHYARKCTLWDLFR